MLSATKYYVQDNTHLKTKWVQC